MKILMVSSYLPYPLLDGGRIRLYNLIKFLSEKHEITLICEKRPNQSQADIDEISKLCKKVIAIERPKALSLGNIAKAAFSLNSLLLITHTNKKITEKIKDELKNNKFDLIHVETFYVMQNLPKVDIPVVLTEHNIEYMVYEKYADKSNFIIKPFLYFDILKLKRNERSYWKKSNKLIAVSPKEQKLMGPNTELVPNGVDVSRFKLKKFNFERQTKIVLFIGNFKWVQNRDSLNFILKNIWPRIVSENNNKYDLKFWVVGKNIPDSIKSSGDETVFFDENAPEDTVQIFQSSDILLTPIRVGGGSNFKILESMAVGTPVVTSPLGNEGLEAKPDSEIFICSKPEEYVQTVLNLLKDEYLYEKVSRNSRIFIEQNFDWLTISKKLDTIYNNVIRE